MVSTLERIPEFRGLVGTQNEPQLSRIAGRVSSTTTGSAQKEGDRATSGSADNSAKASEEEKASQASNSNAGNQGLGEAGLAGGGFLKCPQKKRQMGRRRAFGSLYLEESYDFFV